MEPRIRYAKTVDGGAVAYWSYGSGPNLLHLPWLPWGHAELECRDPELSLWYESLASISTLTRYDGRGSGLSDRIVASYGIETQLADIDAVVAQSGIQPFALLASLNMGPAALHYVARHPERVTHLILWCTYARTEDYSSSLAVGAIRSLMESDWVLYTETGAHAFVGWNAGDSAHSIARLMREGTTPEVARQFYADMRYIDCASLLPEIRVPTLVIHPRQFPLIDVSIARALASSIPNSRFGIFEGDSVSPTRGELKGVVECIADFLGEEIPLQPSPISAQEANHMPNNRDGLSARELEVLKLIAGGKSNREIADVLVLSPRTVERHVANIYTKVNVNNRAQAAAYAISNYLA